MSDRKSAKSQAGPPVIRNKKARFNFHVEDSIEAGISLLGSEVKSLREGQANLDEAFARVRQGEVLLYNMHIGPYEQAREQHEPRRTRKLLLHRREIDRFLGRAASRGYTLVPLEVHWKRGRAKVELAIAKGKREFDKRQDLRLREARREIDRALSRRGRSRREP
jgi:SsrA-binding protein